jgi:thioredoxin-related protein
MTQQNRSIKSLSSNKAWHHPPLLAVLIAILYVSLIPCLSAAERPSFPDPPHFIFWEYDFEEALKTATMGGGPVVAYAYSEGCDFCQRMEEDTFSNPDVIRFSQSHVFLRMDADSHASQRFMERYHVENLPTVIVLSSSGQEVFRVSDHMGPSQFLEKMGESSQVVSRYSRHDRLNDRSLTFYLDYARKAFKHLQFLEATKALDCILYRDPDNKQGLNDEVLLLFGTSLVYLYQLDAAEILLARLCTEHPDSGSVPDAMYILGEIYVQTNRVGLGQELLRKLTRKHPGHPMAQRAEMSLVRIEQKNRRKN